eukprot:256860-Alexandrium_andersonii.AAC.1
MSASLVGSEMCIRDSTLSFRSVLIFASNGRRQAFSPWRLMGSTKEQSVGCLLYTSDAADDM